MPAWYQPVMLTLSGITVRLGGHTILDGASATLIPGSRVGLIGRNGAGKSTLMKVVAGEIESDAGTVDMRRGASLGYLAQDVPAGSDSPLERVLAADVERTRLLEEEAAAATSQRIGDIHERLQAIDAYSAPARAARILAGLGFDEAAQQQTVDSFSGGWRMRIALAALLFSRPDVLLLDEPSNYLDLEAALWLESFLRGYRGTLLVISHERDLLNSVCDHILHLQGGEVTLYRGNYDAWERQRSERLGQIEAMRARQERQRAKLMAYVDRWRYKAHTARQAQSRLKALQRMEPVAAAIEDSTLQFDFPNPDTLRPPMILLDDASVGYTAGQPVLARLQLRIDPDERIAFLGRNGNGKTTLARLLSGRLGVMGGSMTAASRLRVGYFAQHQVEELEPGETPLVHMTRLMPDAAPRRVRAQLGRFGFSGDKAALPVCQLSGGERARLALALITRDAPHLIILDEPTNHLDIEARESLVQALSGYNGAVIMISHDRHLVELTADRLVLVADGKATDFAGNLDDYRSLVLGRDSGSTASRSRRKDERRRAAVERERTRELKKAVDKAENEVNELTRSRDEIDRILFDPSTHEGTTVTELMTRRRKIETALEKAETRWIEASTTLESATRS